MTVRRRRYQDASGGTGVPVDDLVDLAGASVSVAAREMCCRAAADGGSFARAAAALGRPAGLRVSDEQLRRVAGSEGRAVVAWQDDGQPELDVDAGTWPAAGPGSAGGPAGGAVASRAYVGVDGFMLPVVTDAEAGRRFDKAVARRKATPRRRGVRRPRLARRPGADQRYKEAKLVVAHDQAKSRRLVRATRTGGVRRAGRCLRQVAADVRLRRAGQVVAVTDGAEWIAGLLATDLPRPTGAGATTTLVLDYYHAAEHVHAARRALFGEASADGDAWAERVLAALNDGPFDALWDVPAGTRARAAVPAETGGRGRPDAVPGRAAAQGRLPRVPGRRAGRRLRPDRGHVQGVVPPDEGRRHAVGRPQPGADGGPGGVAPERPLAYLLVIQARRLKDWQTLPPAASRLGSESPCAIMRRPPRSWRITTRRNDPTADANALSQPSGPPPSNPAGPLRGFVPSCRKQTPIGSGFDTKPRSGPLWSVMFNIEAE